MITKATTSRYLLGDFINFIKNILVIITGNAIVASEIKTFTEALQAKHLQIDAAYAYQKDSPESKEIETQDVRRDVAFMGIKTVANGFAMHFDEAKRQAAKAILACIAKYGKDIQVQSDTTETTILDKMVTDFETDPILVAACETLGITSWVGELKAANQKFNAKFLERNKKYALKPKESASELKPQVTKVYEALMVQIDSRNNIDTTGKYTPLVNEINALIAQHNNKVTARESSGGNASTAAPKG
ncbi:DUF6261 family protein [Parasediminibacterium paludis]|uniref:DUF6261 family protein n=1 Tax=Parasediminibacterium paludis TaxID=908966 RepID=A0ABV8PVV7_9BACT